MTDREQSIRQRAYEIWIEQGKPEGRESEHWNQAARELGYDDAPAADSNEIPKADEDQGDKSGGVSPGQVAPPD